MIKNATLTLLLSLGILAASAQDVIVKKDGKTVEGKVTEVGIDRITYKISNSESSANFVILKSEVSRIEFDNGQTVFISDKLDRGRRRGPGPQEKPVSPQDSEPLGGNMINISPFKALDSGPGFGVSYEVLLDKKGYFGLLLPLTITIPGTYSYMDVSDTNGSFMFYVSPGLKIYPFGQRKVTYAVGPSLFFGRGERWDNSGTYDPTTGTYINGGRSNTMTRMGLIVNNYVNFQVTPKFQIGLNGGLGSRFVDREAYSSRISYTRGLQITGEFNFSLGFRF
jgi:hypothetical protein